MGSFVKIWEGWKKLAQKIGDFQVSILFSVLYFVLIVPVGLVASAFTDILQIKKFPEWNKMEDSSSTFNKLRRQS